jgi:hypothetical protein
MLVEPGVDLRKRFEFETREPQPGGVDFRTLSDFELETTDR